MNRKIFFFASLLISLLSFNSCKNMVNSSSSTAKIKFNVADFESNNRSATVRPEKYTEADYNLFILTGYISQKDAENYKDNESVVTEIPATPFAGIEALKAASYEIAKGEWTFILEAKALYNGSSTKIAESFKTLQINEGSNTVSFNLEFLEDEENLGLLKVNLSYPSGMNITETKIEIYKYSDDSRVTEATGDNVTQELNPGYYLVKFIFVTDNGTIIPPKTELVQIKSYHTTILTRNYNDDDLIQKNKVYKLTYKDYKGNVFTGQDMNSSYLLIADNEEISLPGSIESNVNTDYRFEGWFLTKECDGTPVSKINGADLSDNATIYAKWTYDIVYLDPDMGNDSNSGMTPAAAVKSVAEAKKYLNNSTSEFIYLMNGIATTEDIKDLSNITSAEYNYTIVKRGQSFTTGQMINMNGVETITLENLTLDGGADWGSNGAIANALTSKGYGNYSDDSYGAMNGIEASGSVIFLNKGTLNLGENVKVQNNKSTSKGSGIYVTESGKLNITSDTVVIADNVSKDCGGGIYILGNEENSPIVNILGGTISGNAAQKGGGIYIEGKSEVTISSSDPAKPVIIEGNRAYYSSGGGLATYASSSNLQPSITIKNVHVLNNVAANTNASSMYGGQGSGGGMYFSYYPKVTISDSEISGNYSAESGGGFTCGTNGPSITVTDTKILSNYVMNTGKTGAGISATSGNITLQGDTVIASNKFMNINGTELTGNGSGFYLSGSRLTLADNAYISEENDLYYTGTNSSIGIVLNSSLTKPEKQDYIFRIIPASYPTQKRTLRVIGFETGMLETSKYTLIDLIDVQENASNPMIDYSFDLDGYLNPSINSSIEIEDPFDYDLSFQIERNDYEITVSALLNGEAFEIEKLENFEIKVFYNDYDTNAFVNSNVVTLGSNWPSGTYMLYVSGKYKNKTFSNSFEITLTD